MAKLYYFSRLRRGPLAVMLLAVLAVVFQGAVRVVAHPVGSAQVRAIHDHENCASHLHPSAHTTGAISADSGTDTEQMPMPAWQLDCCAAVSAAVLPVLDVTQLTALTLSRGVLPKPSALLEGLPPAAPSKPPRTSYQG